MFIYNSNFAVLNIQTIKKNYSVALTDDVLLCNVVNGNIVIKLPTPLAVYKNRNNTPFYIKKTDASANTVTVESLIGNIDGSGTYVLSAQNDMVAVVSDGSNFYAVGMLSSGGGSGGTNASQTGFAAYLSANQSVAGSSARTLLQLDTVVFNPDGDYDNTTFLYTASIAGYYQVECTVFGLSISTLSDILPLLYKNGALFANGPTLYNYAASSKNVAGTAEWIVQLGVGDTLSFYIQNDDSGAININGNSVQSTRGSAFFIHS